MERWPSGLRRTLGKRVKRQLFHGFESHSLRQKLTIFYAANLMFFINFQNYKRAIYGKN